MASKENSGLNFGFLMGKQQQEQGKCEQVVYVVFVGFESRLLILGIPFFSGTGVKTWGIGSFLCTQLGYLIIFIITTLNSFSGRLPFSILVSYSYGVLSYLFETHSFIASFYLDCCFYF